MIDTSALLAVLLNEPSREWLIARTEGAELAAPQALHWEIGNALSVMLKRKRLTLPEARLALEGYAHVSLRLLDVELDDALAIAAAGGIYAYDAYFVACARMLAAPLLTLDSGLIVAAEAAGVRVVGPWE